jgi:copper transport protein
MTPRRLVPVVLCALVLVLLAAAPASAHAVLVSSDPPANASLETAPRAITLTFTEPVEVALGSVRVLDARGQRVDRGRVGHPGGDSSRVRIELRDGLRGGYAVGWRVVSADSHPVSGAFTFGVGSDTGTSASAVAGELAVGAGSSRAVGIAFAVARFFLFAGLVLLVGVAAFVIALWPGGYANRLVRRLLWVSWGVTAVATAATIGLQGAYAAGLPLSGAFDPSVAGAVLTTRYGIVSAARLALLVVLLPVVILLGRPRPPRTGEPREQLAEDAAALGAIGLLLTPGLAGHAGTGFMIPLGIFADVVHLAAVSIWLGGLVVLTGVVLRSGDPGALREVVPRFSRVAFLAVVTITVSGVVQAWRQLGTVGALTSTAYGRILLVKVALVAVVVGVAWVSRRVVQRRLGAGALVARPAGPGTPSAEPGEDTTARLRRSAGIEVVLTAGVLVLTALLVQAPPGRAGAGGDDVAFGNVAPGAPASAAFGATLKTGDNTVVVTFEPARTGTNQLHFTILDASGQLLDAPGLRASLSLESQGLGPLPMTLQKLGPGHYWAANVLVPIPGEWKLTVLLRTSDVDEHQATTQVRIE